jgi:hypothetical protein
MVRKTWLTSLSVFALITLQSPNW